ncbi:MAG: serine/threonine-protein kinase [Acidobacteria bacterium]|nr:serine/threonine-protein kinase [Acidobacteriota bacterium]
MSLVGRTIGRYRITEKLGEGGMGVVYRAQDATLGRDVAIKVLRPELGRQPERVRRFSREARAASALNHPNIITVHDAGEFEDGPFLVMELVEGESLRALLRRGPLPLAKVLDIGIQAATALARAHESGITHRDLKPENLLVRPDGYVKILDFGLAKLKEKEPPAEGASAATTVDAGLTSEGSILGTAAYMSPEQATGRHVDGRSDIFSLALVLFECRQGRHPFLRENVLDTLHAIAHDRLPALAYPAGGPEWGLARVLEKALEKDPDERYQTMKDLGIDLRRLRQESASGKVASSTVAAPARPTRRPLLYALAGLALLALLAGGALMVFRSRQSAEPARHEYTQLTNFADSAVAPGLSPDGRMLAFIRGESTSPGPGEIYVKLLPDGEPVQLTHDGSTKVGPTIFSPDGSRIAYTAGPSMYNSDTWIVPVLGGEPSRMLANASGLTWAEGGAGPRRILFSEMTGQGIHMGIFTSMENRSEQRKVYLPAGVGGMAHRSFLSPDHRSVLVAEMSDGWLPCRLVPYDGSSLGKPVGPSPAQCTDAAWSPDGKWMYFSANAGNGFHIWRQRFPDGEPEQVTPGATEEQGLAFAADGRSFVTSVGASQSTLWVHDARGDRQITSQGYAYLPSFSADGKRLYYLVRSRPNRRFVSGELWVANLGTGQRERLLPDFLIEHYSVSADDNRVVFVAIDEAGHSPVWLATLDGRAAPRRLASTDSARAFFGAKGDIFFVGTEGEGKTRFLYRTQEDGSGLQRVVPNPVVYLYDVSPDGKGLAAWIGRSVVVYPAGGGSPTVVCSSGANAGGDYRAVTPPLVSWSRDGKFLYVHVRTGSRTFALPLRPGQILPPLPASGLPSLDDAAALPGARLIPQPRAFGGPNPSVYAFARVTTHRNIYRIPVP